MPLLALLGTSIASFFGFIARILVSFWGNLAIFISFIAPGLLSAVLKLLGIGLVTFVGFLGTITFLKNFLLDRYSGIPTDLLQILSLMKVDVGMSLLFAAMSIAMTIKMTTKATTMVWRKPGSGSGGSISA